MNRNQLKIIAVTAMVLDHVAVMFLIEGSTLWLILRTVGRLTAPIMCFFLSEGFRYTSSVRKYAWRLGIFALLSQIPYALALRDQTSWWNPNVIYTLTISLFCLMVWQHRNAAWRNPVLAVLLLATLPADWGIIAPLFVLAFYSARRAKCPIKKVPAVFAKIEPSLLWQTYAYIVVSLLVLLAEFLSSQVLDMPLESFIYECGILLFVPLLLSYNGHSGSSNPAFKWGFYIFYPVHLLVLYVIRLMIR